MGNLAGSAGWGMAVAASLLLGAIAAATLELPQRVAATITALGGGVLLAAVAFELVPEADQQAGATVTAAGLVAGMLIYVGADAWLNRDDDMKSMRRAGHAAAAGRKMSLPDRAEATRGESIAVGLFVDGLLGGIGVALAGATILGGTVLVDASPAFIGGAQAVAGGAVLSVVSISIIPHAFDEVSGLVAAALVVGFVCGYLLG